jgi:hypothetical protein
MKRYILWYNFCMLKPNYLERSGKLPELNRSFDLAFWQSQPPAARFDSAWELVMHYARVKGLDVRQLQLHRSVESFQRQQCYLIDAELLAQVDSGADPAAAH